MKQYIFYLKLYLKSERVHRPSYKVSVSPIYILLVKSLDSVCDVIQEVTDQRRKRLVLLVTLFVCRQDMVGSTPTRGLWLIIRKYIGGPLCQIENGDSENCPSRFVIYLIKVQTRHEIRL